MTEVSIITKSELLEKCGIIHGFSQRTGGVSKSPVDSLNTKKSPLVPDSIENVAINIKRIMKDFPSVDNGVLLYLEGGDNVVKIEDCAGFKTLYGYDGAVTDQKDCFLAVTVADCLPILLVDASAEVIGISHAGWKGSAGKITTKVIEQMLELGAKPANIEAVIGPGICGDCYEVDEEISKQFSSDVTEKRQNGKYLLNIVKANMIELRGAGVSEIEVIDICTYENTNKFFSARKEVETGRFLAYISR